MPGVIMTTSDIPDAQIQGYYDRNLLERARPELVHGLFAQVKTMPKNAGTRINFRRWESLPVNTTPLAEGVTPTGKKITTTTIHATLKQYGDFVTLSDFLQLTGLDSTIVETTDVLGEQMGETDDILDRDNLLSGTQVRYGTGVAGRSSVTNALAKADIDNITRALESANGKPIKKMVVAGAKIATKPVRQAYIAIGHTDLRYDIEQIAGFKSVEEYASQGDVLPGEIGATGGIRWLLTTNGYIAEGEGAAVGATGLKAVDATNIDVYCVIIQAQNCYGRVPLAKGSVKAIVKQLGSAGTEDPLDQRSTVGWKFARTGRVLNDDHLCRLEVGVTALA